MRISADLSNREVFLAVLCGALLAPAIWIVLAALQILAEGMG